MTITHWEHRRRELLWSIGILAFTLLVECVIIIITDGERLLPIAGASIVAVVLVYEIAQFDLHRQKKDRS